MTVGRMRMQYDASTSQNLESENQDTSSAAEETPQGCRVFNFENCLICRIGLLISVILTDGPQARRAPIIVSAPGPSTETASIAKSVIVRATSATAGSSSIATQVIEFKNSAPGRYMVQPVLQQSLRDFKTLNSSLTHGLLSGRCITQSLTPSRRSLMLGRCVTYFLTVFDRSLLILGLCSS